MALFSSSPAGPAAQPSPVLDYYMKRQLSPQWRAFLAAFSSELYQSADPEDAQEFLRQIGGHMADLVPLTRLETLEELEDEINANFATMDWGFAELNALDDGIEIIHRACPTGMPEDKAGYWASSLTAVLEGLYTQWFISQGSQSHLVTRCVETQQAGTLIFRHGR